MARIERRSPVRQLASRVASAEEAQAAWRTLAVCDVSAREKRGYKGRGAEAWLRRQGLAIPETIYETRSLSGGGLIARLGTADFFLEAGDEGLPAFSAVSGEVYPVERHDAAFVLAGARALAVLAQMSSFDFRTAERGRMVLTRAAGVNCAVLPEMRGEVPMYRLWVDHTYGVSFWESLVEIAEELGGRVVGASQVSD